MKLKRKIEIERELHEASDSFKSNWSPLNHVCICFIYLEEVASSLSKSTKKRLKVLESPPETPTAPNRPKPRQPQPVNSDAEQKKPTQSKTVRFSHVKIVNEDFQSLGSPITRGKKQMKTSLSLVAASEPGKSY